MKELHVGDPCLVVHPGSMFHGLVGVVTKDVPLEHDPSWRRYCVQLAFEGLDLWFNDHELIPYTEDDS